MSDNPRQVLEANQTFVCEVGGETITVHQGRTRVAASHALARAYPDRFKPVEEGLSFPEVEEATDEPGRGRARPAAKEEDRELVGAGASSEPSSGSSSRPRGSSTAKSGGSK